MILSIVLVSGWTLLAIAYAFLWGAKALIYSTEKDLDMFYGLILIVGSQALVWSLWALGIYYITAM